jgi:hypothetical protein
MKKNLSRIKNIPLRDYWKNEATDFSKWLSKDYNLKLLSDTIGIDLEFIKREATKDSRLRVDILAKDRETGEIIIIENQLEETDHSHLGKLITYASIFKSNTIIWIVKEIRNEHELAINWLNNNTKEELNLFLLKVQLITIDNSNPAPLFTILSKPINHNLPKIKSEFGNETIEIIKEREVFERELLDSQIIVFFDKTIEPFKRFSKTDSNPSSLGLINLLEKYSLELHAKYSIRQSRKFKKDLFLWAKYRGLKVNQAQYERTGHRDYKANGKEYFEFTN